MNNKVHYEVKIGLILNFAMNSMWLQSEILISSFIHISDWSRISVLFTYLDFMISRSEVIERCIFLLFR